MSKMLWLDLETTGLDPIDCDILEIGAIVTDKDLNELDRFHVVIRHSNTVLYSMNALVTHMHTKSGLVTEVRNSLVSIGEAEKRLIAFIKKNFKTEKAILAGSSVHFDKKFLEEEFPRAAALLHHRIIDVSSFKETLRIVFGYKIDQKKPIHRALDDLAGSMSEYRDYLKFFKVPSNERPLMVEE